MKTPDNSQYYRPNVAAVIMNQQGLVLHCGRQLAKLPIWQFPQGGIEANESYQSALFRELKEETNIDRNQVVIIDQIDQWLYYRFPKKFLRKDNNFIGQKQRWYLLIVNDDAVKLRSNDGEFSAFEWVSYFYPLATIVDFKVAVYRQVLQTFLPAYQRHLDSQP